MGSLSGSLSFLGGYQVCHNICMALVALLTFLGFTVVGMPLLFLQKVAIPFWIIATILLSIIVTLNYKRLTHISNKVVLLNLGLLIAGTPFKSLQSFAYVFWLIGGILIFSSAIWYVKGKISAKGGRLKKVKISIGNALLIFILLLVLGLFAFSVSNFIPIRIADTAGKSVQGIMPKSASRMSLTSFDADLARKAMDKNNDGKCDFCGMPVEQCISSGQLECSMDPNAKIGILGSKHIHADWKVYIDGKALDLSDKSHMERMRNNQPVSSFIHVDSGAPSPEKTGDVIHMHATGVPLWIFFKSVGMEFGKDCLTLENKERFCNEGNKKLKFYVNGQLNNEFENYVFNDLDKILISYGGEGEEEIKNQLSTITDFGNIH